ncbi:unnamed protein product [Moneuplotes crassus]|uniref:Uncharacterized protein n=1 Tax=Euplotes crassus TaxID=5936 RepID=A0AAD1X5Z8_EUPCR|nr:unnamed protein product [Moneuplotes crassus]
MRKALTNQANDHPKIVRKLNLKSLELVSKEAACLKKILGWQECEISIPELKLKQKGCRNHQGRRGAGCRLCKEVLLMCERNPVLGKRRLLSPCSRNLKTLRQFLVRRLSLRLITTSLHIIKKEMKMLISSIITKHMEFESDKPISSLLAEGKDSGGWKKLMNFITKEDQVIFRRSLKKINNQLYSRLRKIISKNPRNKYFQLQRSIGVADPIFSDSSESNSPVKNAFINHNRISLNFSSMPRCSKAYGSFISHKPSDNQIDKVLMNIQHEEMSTLIGKANQDLAEKDNKKKEETFSINFDEQMAIIKERSPRKHSSFKHRKKAQLLSKKNKDDIAAYCYLKKSSLRRNIKLFEPVEINRSIVNLDTTKCMNEHESSLKRPISKVQTLKTMHSSCNISVDDSTKQQSFYKQSQLIPDSEKLVVNGRYIKAMQKQCQKVLHTATKSFKLPKKARGLQVIKKRRIKRKMFLAKTYQDL